MSRDPRYTKLLNDKRWKELRAWKLRQTGGYCEKCLAEGWKDLQAVGIDVHHKVPVETGRTEQEMERLCYDPNNLQVLCVKHHIQAHQELRSFDRENVQANKQRKRDMFMQRNDPNYCKPETEKQGNSKETENGKNIQ